MISKIKRFAMELYHRCSDDDVSALGAQLTYNVILAFFPFLIFLMTLIGYTPLSKEDALQSLATALPQEAYQLVRDIVVQVVEERHDALLSFGMIATLWAASNGLSAVIKGLNKAYDEEETRPIWKVKGIALGSTLALALVMIVTLGLLVLGGALEDWLYQTLGYPSAFRLVWRIIQVALPIGAIFGVFIMLYRFIPNRRLSFRAALPGAIAVSLGWSAVSLLFAFYVNHFGSYDRTYGSLAGVIVLLSWLYLCSCLIMIGGEINAALAFKREQRSKPACKVYKPRMQWLFGKGSAGRGSRERGFHM